MLLRRAASFFDPEIIWQQLETQCSLDIADGLAEHYVVSYAGTSLYLGIVRATGERTFWLKATGSQPAISVDLPEAVWVKQIIYPDHTLLTAVLTEPEAEAPFSELVRNVLADLEQAPAGSCVTTLLISRLQQWQPATPLRLAA